MKKLHREFNETGRHNKRGSLWLKVLVSKTRPFQSSSVRPFIYSSFFNYTVPRWIDGTRLKPRSLLQPLMNDSTEVSLTERVQVCCSFVCKCIIGTNGADIESATTQVHHCIIARVCMILCICPRLILVSPCLCVCSNKLNEKNMHRYFQFAKVHRAIPTRGQTTLESSSLGMHSITLQPRVPLRVSFRSKAATYVRSGVNNVVTASIDRLICLIWSDLIICGF